MNGDSEYHSKPDTRLLYEPGFFSNSKMNNNYGNFKLKIGI